MTAKLLNGEQIAKPVLAQITQDILQRHQQGLRAPTFAVVLVGDNPASHIYVRNKRNACRTVGINSLDHNLPATTTQQQLLDLINQLNNDTNVDGILVQLPLPAQINTADILESVASHKDVDGFHPYNLGRLAQGRPYMRPCTSAAIMLMLQQTSENLVGKKATVVGTSNIVGLPTVLELITAGATVTACNNNTHDLPSAVVAADILVVATGNPNLIKGEWIKPGSIVIDVGMNRTANGSIVGDVEFAAAAARAAWITPVPGGVGPVTIACLLQNTLLACVGRD